MFKPIVIVGTLLALAGCAETDKRIEPGFRNADGSWPVYEGGNYGAPGIGGSGADDLDPWLSGTNPGQRLVLSRFDHNFNGRIGEDRARRANNWFRRYADRNHDLRIDDDEINRGLAALDAALSRDGD